MSSVKVIFVWENFGPGHDDRCTAVAERLGAPETTLGIEIFSKSSAYAWENRATTGFIKKTIFPGAVVEDVHWLHRAWMIFINILKYPKASVFFCHYENVSTFLCASLLRFLGRRVYVMNASKFDDYPRTLFRELVKALFYLPYIGAIGSGIRSKDYFRFLGFHQDKIKINYNTLSLRRIRENSGGMGGYDFSQLEITVVARLINKKNLFLTLDAYALYFASARYPRRLNILGNGELDAALKAYAEKININHLINWSGFVQTEDVSKVLARSVFLLLLSTEEQFGNVVIEALALNIPCIVSTQVGARDNLIRSGVNGFIVESDNPQGAAFFMKILSDDEQLWRTFSSAAGAFAEQGDVSSFSSAVIEFIDANK